MPQAYQPQRLMERSMKKLENKTVIVTGGGGGIGGATCRRLALEGAKIAVVDMNLEAAQRGAADIQSAGSTAAAYKCDITHRVGVDAAVAATQTPPGPPDALINNTASDAVKPLP